MFEIYHYPNSNTKKKKKKTTEPTKLTILFKRHLYSYFNQENCFNWSFRLDLLNVYTIKSSKTVKFLKHKFLFKEKNEDDLYLVLLAFPFFFSFYFSLLLCTSQALRYLFVRLGPGCYVFESLKSERSIRMKNFQLHINFNTTVSKTDKKKCRVKRRNEK